MLPTTGSPGTAFDPNMARAIEELAHVIQQVDQRVQLVKLGLVQSFPHLALSLGVNRAAFPSGFPTGFPTGFPNTTGVTGTPVLVGPYFGAPTVWPTLPTVAAFSQPGFLAAPGVMTPFPGLAASYPPFRL